VIEFLQVKKKCGWELAACVWAKAEYQERRNLT